MNKTLIFDLGGVLVENDMFHQLPRLMREPVSEAELKTRWLRSPAVRTFELGRCSPDAFATMLNEEFQLSASPEDFLAAFSGWPRGLHRDAEVLLRDLRARCTIGCLSNSNELHWTTGITAHFDHCYSSHLLQRIKPDAEVFEYVTTDIGCQPGEIVFFDDSQLNIDAARAAGWEAHLTVGFEALERTLAETGIRSS